MLSNDHNFYHENENDVIWWLDNSSEVKGEFVFSFDRKKLYNLFRDYPYNLSTEEKEIFDAENPFWKDFFSDRLK